MENVEYENGKFGKESNRFESQKTVYDVIVQPGSGESSNREFSVSYEIIRMYYTLCFSIYIYMYKKSGCMLLMGNFSFVMSLGNLLSCRGRMENVYIKITKQLNLNCCMATIFPFKILSTGKYDIRC